MRRKQDQNIFGGACEESVIQMYLEGHEESKIENFLSTEAISHLFKVLQVNKGTFIQNTLKHWLFCKKDFAPPLYKMSGIVIVLEEQFGWFREPPIGFEGT